MSTIEKEKIAEKVEELETPVVEEGGEELPIEGEVELDEDGNPKEPVELEAWQITGEEENTEKPEKSLKAKKKWKREAEAKNEENEKLKAENEKLKAERNNSSPSELKRPDPLDFDDDDTYEEAKEQHLIKMIRLEDQENANTGKIQALMADRALKVDVHNQRVGNFIEDKNINPDVYGSAESAFIAAIEEVTPGSGGKNADMFLSKLGEGSERIPYFLGRNKAKLAEFKRLLKEDTSGISAGMFLADQNRKLRGGATGTIKSKAPNPAATATGDTMLKTNSASEKSMKAKYLKAHKEGNGSLAFDIKRQAKKEHKINTNDW